MELNCIITSLNAVRGGCRNKKKKKSAVTKIGVSISFNILVSNKDFIDMN